LQKQRVQRVVLVRQVAQLLAQLEALAALAELETLFEQIYNKCVYFFLTLDLKKHPKQRLLLSRMYKSPIWSNIWDFN
jgi:hypothetical protein